MKKSSFYTLLLIVIMFSCTTNDDVQAREQSLCDCEITVITYENGNTNSTVINEEISNEQSSCANDGQIISDTNSSNQAVVTTWSCQ